MITASTSPSDKQRTSFEEGSAYTVTREAIVTKILDAGHAEVAVVRESACGGNCASCGGCAHPDTLHVVAENTAGATAGERVTVESRTAPLLGAAALVYVLPLALFLLGLGLAAAFGAAEGVTILVSLACLALGCGGAVALHKTYQRRHPITFVIRRQD